MTNSKMTGSKMSGPSLSLAMSVSALLFFAEPLFAQQIAPFRGFEAEMTEAERRATGINKLSPAERAALNAWLQTRIGGFAPGIEGTPAPATAVEPDVPAVAAPEAPVETAVPAVLVPEPEAAEVPSADAAREASIEAEVERRVAQQMAAPRNAVEMADRGEDFTATLKPPFSGWTGRSIFTLENGHRWRQRSKARWTYTGNDLRVRFEQNWLGGWEMTLIDADETVLVGPMHD